MEVLSTRIRMLPDSLQPGNVLLFTTAAPFLTFGIVRVHVKPDTVVKKNNVPLNWQGAKKALRQKALCVFVSGDIRVEGVNPEFILDVRTMNIDEEA